MKSKLFKSIMILFFLINMLMIKAPALEDTLPSVVEPPSISDLRLLKTVEGVPYFCLTVHIPQTVLSLNFDRPFNGRVELEAEGMSGSMGWGSSAGGSGRLDVFMNDPVPDISNSYYLYYEINEKGLTESAVNEKNYSYRLRFKYIYNKQGSSEELLSEWSNELSSQSAKYLGASPWAVPELDSAAEYGFVTSRIRGNMSTEITREEFAELAVRLYELCSGKKAVTGEGSFSDNSNPEVLKAFNLGIVQGVGEDRFAPDRVITRQQMAKIIYNTLKLLLPESELYIENKAVFSDDSCIEDWARECVCFCSNASLINGFISGEAREFRPNSCASRQSAVIVCKRAYEYYLNSEA